MSHFADFNATQLWAGVNYDTRPREQTIIGRDVTGAAVGMNTSKLLPSQSVGRVDLSTIVNNASFVPSVTLIENMGEDLNVEFVTDNKGENVHSYLTQGVVGWTRRSVNEIVDGVVPINPVEPISAVDWSDNEWLYYRTTDVDQPVSEGVAAYEGARSRPLAVRTVVPPMTLDMTQLEINDLRTSPVLKFKQGTVPDVTPIDVYCRVVGSNNKDYIKGVAGVGDAVTFTFDENFVLPLSFPAKPEVEIIWEYTTNPHKIVFDFVNETVTRMIVTGDDFDSGAPPVVTVISAPGTFNILSTLSLDIISDVIGIASDAAIALDNVTVGTQKFDLIQ